MTVRQTDIRESGIDWDNIWRESGNSGYSPDTESRQIFERAKEEIFNLCRPMFGYELYPNDRRSQEAETLRIGGRELMAGKTISSFLCDAEEYAVFVATAGMEFENYCRGLSESGDIVKMFFADMIGSAIADTTGRIAVDEITGIQEAAGKKVSFSYSPGHCEWPVSDQKTLFSLLPPEPCGIRLQDSGLMIPIKSVSGIVGIGRELRKRQHSCAICNMIGCFRRFGGHTFNK